MYRLFLFWRPYMAQRVLGAMLVLVPACLIIGLPLPWTLAAAFVAAVGSCWNVWWSLWRFRAITRQFQTIRDEEVVVHYSPHLGNAIDFAQVLGRAETISTEFVQLFGFRLRRRLVVFVFASVADLSRFFKSQVHACAFPGGDAIALGIHGSVSGTLEEVVRHELAHLYSARWRKLDLVLTSEGMATWLMRTLQGKPVDALARLDFE